MMPVCLILSIRMQFLLSLFTIHLLFLVIRKIVFEMFIILICDLFMTSHCIYYFLNAQNATFGNNISLVCMRTNVYVSLFIFNH